MRVFRTTAVVAVLAAVFAASAWAFGFTDEAQLPPDLHLGSPYSFQLSARSGCPPYYYEHQSGSFPPGVSMGRDGLISGTPQMGGTYRPWLAVKNQCPGDSSERLFTFYVLDSSPFVIRTAALKAAASGVSYQAELLSSEGGVLAWTLNTGQLPTGLTLSKDGVINGIPAADGSFTFRVKVNDGRRTATKEFTLVVALRLGFATKHLPRASVGHALRTRIVVQGGVAPRQVTIVRGALPRGVRFASGVLFGTPRVAGRFQFVVKVTDAQGASSTQTFVLSVRR